MNFDNQELHSEVVDMMRDAAKRHKSDWRDKWFKLIPDAVTFALQFDACLLPLDMCELTPFFDDDFNVTFHLNAKYWQRIANEQGGYFVLGMRKLTAVEKTRVAKSGGGFLTKDDLAVYATVLTNAQLDSISRMPAPIAEKMTDSLPRHLGTLTADEIALMPNLKNYAAVELCEQRALTTALKSMFAPPRASGFERYSELVANRHAIADAAPHGRDDMTTSVLTGGRVKRRVNGPTAAEMLTENDINDLLTN